MCTIHRRREPAAPARWALYWQRRSVGRRNVRSKSLGPKTAKNTKRACLLEPSRGARYPPAVGRVRGPRVGCMSCIGCAVVGSCCVGWVGIERSRSRAQLERGRSERSRSRARAGSGSSGVGVERRARSSSSVERGRSRALSEGESGRRKRSASSVARDRRRTSRALGVERRARWESSEERDKSRAAREMGVGRRKTRVERFERSPISCISGTRSGSSVERARRGARSELGVERREIGVVRRKTRVERRARAESIQGKDLSTNCLQL